MYSFSRSRLVGKRTCPAIARGPLAQLAEQRPFKAWVPSSILGRLISNIFYYKQLAAFARAAYLFFGDMRIFYEKGSVRKAKKVKKRGQTPI
ncbi:hypothetical protein SPIROBIBN47_250005 [uncultured spirochete]|uniref:Uncharacterized protein n=1 Tax=uncultured spirochete TaxID=156406 RepID=A0A3P3XHX4_9SPIR|nr:hypothetical protein SPIROBIBN47_250005 [uncultured spirochete]